MYEQPSIFFPVFELLIDEFKFHFPKIIFLACSAFCSETFPVALTSVIAETTSVVSDWSESLLQPKKRSIIETKKILLTLNESYTKLLNNPV